MSLQTVWGTTFGGLQKIGKALMLPVSVLPVAGILLGVGASIAREAQTPWIAEIGRISERQQLRMFAYGHAGDGNLHVNVLWNEDHEIPQVEGALGAVMRTVVGMGGCLTGEHGIGSSKSKYLELEQSAELIALERGVKQLFDPHGILNPGKIFPRKGHGAC